MGSIGGRFAATVGVLATALILTACGGGGGSATDLVVTPPVIVAPPVVLVFSCWNGTILSGTVQPTKVGCAAVPDTAVKAVITGTALSFSGIPTNATLASSTVTATAQSGSVVTWSNGAITSGAMLFSTTYTFTGGKLTFSNAPDMTIAGNFTTGANPTAFVWPTDVKTLVEPGIVNGAVNAALAVRTWLALNPASETVGDDAWNANRKSGNTVVIKTAEKAADTNGVQRPIWREVYKFTAGTAVGYCIRPVFGDTGLAYSVQQTCFNEAPAYVIGVSDSVTSGNNGVIYRGTGANANTCARSTIALGDKIVPCPF